MSNLQSLAVLAVAGVVGYVLFKGDKVAGLLGDAAGAVGDFVSNPNPISDTAQNAVRKATGNDSWYLSDAIASLTGLADREADYLAPNQAAPLALPSTMK